MEEPGPFKRNGLLEAAFRAKPKCEATTPVGYFPRQIYPERRQDVIVVHERGKRSPHQRQGFKTSGHETLALLSHQAHARVAAELLLNLLKRPIRAVSIEHQ